MDNCIFCKIAKGEIPCHKVYEDKDFLAFLDITPRNKGHTLVIPKRHYRWVWDIKENYSGPVNKVANALKKALDTDYIQSIVMGEEVPHAHIHLVPRYPNDGYGALVNVAIRQKIPEEEMKEIAKKIASFL